MEAAGEGNDEGDAVEGEGALHVGQRAPGQAAAGAELDRPGVAEDEEGQGEPAPMRRPSAACSLTLLPVTEIVGPSGSAPRESQWAPRPGRPKSAVSLSCLLRPL